MFTEKHLDKLHSNKSLYESFLRNIRMRIRKFLYKFDLTIIKETLEENFEKLFTKGRAKYQIIELSEFFCDSVLQLLLWGHTYPTLCKNIFDYTKKINLHLSINNVYATAEDLVEWVIRTPIDDDNQLIRRFEHMIFQGVEMFDYQNIKEFDNERLVESFNGFINEYFSYFVNQGYMATYDVKRICCKWIKYAQS